MSRDPELNGSARPRPRPIVHRSIADATADSLRKLILLGELEPGSKVTQEELSSMLGVSTMPVREALLRLASDGLIETSPNRSYRVVSLTEADIRDMYWVQGRLAGELTRRACMLVDDHLLAELHRLQRSMMLAHDAMDDEAMESYNWAFHRALHMRADSSRLKILLLRTLRYVPVGLYPRIAEWRDETIRGHDAILRALDKGDSAAAGQAAQDHVARAGELLIQEFFDRGYWIFQSPAQSTSRGVS